MRRALPIRILSLLGAILICACECLAAAPEGNGRAVLVTGASTGIGRATAELLAEHGFHVYAGARSQEDIDALNAIENIEAVRLDVTKPEEIAAAVEQVRAGGRGLYGLINNAGVGVVGPLIEISDEDMLFQFDVNVFGPVRVTRAFAPMLIESQGRISTTSSISGFISSGMAGAYSMSKFAIEAYTDALAAEMAPFGVHVSVVEPGSFGSQIGENILERMRERGYSVEESRYAESLQGLLAMLAQKSEGADPAPVAEAFLHAMGDPAPRRRYMVTANAMEARLTLATLMQRIAELNDEQAFALDRAALIEMLDAALAANGGE
jgi:NAD(P)-dependent dehydrogenase (short-subunit alcohol dehydrogenase family)